MARMSTLLLDNKLQLLQAAMHVVIDTPRESETRGPPVCEVRRQCWQRAFRWQCTEWHLQAAGTQLQKGLQQAAWSVSGGPA
jgi:hypothetical protein